MKKKLFMLLMCLCMAMVFTACGGSSEGSNEGTDSNNGSDLVGKWQIKGVQDTNSNSPVALDAVKGTGSIPSDYEMILVIDEDMNCTLFDGKTLGKPFELTDNGDGSFSYTNDEGETPMTVWTEKNTLDFIEGDVALYYGTEDKTVQSYFEKISDSSDATELEPTVNALKVGDTVTSEDWSITLTDAYTNTELSSSESVTSWTADDGYAFLVLEFDVECLNSSQKTVDGDAIINLVATVNGNTYANWEYQYIANEIWCYFRNTYLDANLPTHAYVYTYIPEKLMNDEITVDLTLAGTDYQLSLN